MMIAEVHTCMLGMWQIYMDWFVQGGDISVANTVVRL